MNVPMLHKTDPSQTAGLLMDFFLWTRSHRDNDDDNLWCSFQSNGLARVRNQLCLGERSRDQLLEHYSFPWGLSNACWKKLQRYKSVQVFFLPLELCHIVTFRRMVVVFVRWIMLCGDSYCWRWRRFALLIGDEPTALGWNMEHAKGYGACDCGSCNRGLTGR